MRMHLYIFERAGVSIENGISLLLVNSCVFLELHQCLKVASLNMFANESSLAFDQFLICRKIYL